MSFNGNEGSAIDPSTALQLTSSYQSAYSGTTKAVFIGKTHIEKLLSQTDSKGIRIYFGRDDLNENTVVLVAADSNENDILDCIVDRGIKCPTRCGTSNSTNAISR